MKAIRAFCIECMGGNRGEIKRCTAPGCPLYHFRMGKNPYLPKRPITPDHLEKMRKAKEKAK